jgi:hypothetical protein
MRTRGTDETSVYGIGDASGGFAAFVAHLIPLVTFLWVGRKPRKYERVEVQRRVHLRRPRRRLLHARRLQAWRDRGLWRASGHPQIALDQTQTEAEQTRRIAHFACMLLMPALAGSK